MKKLLYCATLFSFVFFYPAVSMAAEDVGLIVLRLQKEYERINSIEADFTQEILSKSMNKSQTSEGKVSFKKQGKWKWQYTSPIRDELVSNGRTVWVYQPDLNQVMESQVDVTNPNVATDFLTGVGNLKRDFQITLAADKPDVWVLNLVSMQPQQNVKRLLMDVDKSRLLVVKTVLEDLLGNQTSVSFRNIRVNTSMPDYVFEFAAPPGAKVIRQP